MKHILLAAVATIAFAGAAAAQEAAQDAYVNDQMTVQETATFGAPRVDRMQTSSMETMASAHDSGSSALADAADRFIQHR